MSSRFINVLRQAFRTFERSNQAESNFVTNLNVLKQLTEQLTFQDFHINQNEVLYDGIFESAESAPCAYLHILENDVISMGIFILRGGYTMPLHDHPAMHGILRGIYGRLGVQSFTQRPVQQQLHQQESVLAGNGSDEVDFAGFQRVLREIPVLAEEHRIVGPETECALLTPHERNFHEITALGGVAAFFDILSPPYDNIRQCRFYKTIEDSPMGLCLSRIPSPNSYFCDTVETPESLARTTFICSSEAFSNSAAKQ